MHVKNGIKKQIVSGILLAIFWRAETDNCRGGKGRGYGMKDFEIGDF